MTEQAKDRDDRALSTARTSWPPTTGFGIDSSIIGDLGDVILGVTVDSLRGCRIGSGAASDCISVWLSRANDFILLVLPRLHRLVGSGAGAAAARDGQRDRSSRRRGSAHGRPRGGAAARTQQAELAAGAPAGDVKAAARRGLAARRSQGFGTDAAPACGRSARSRGAAQGPRAPLAPYGACLYHLCIVFGCAFGQT